MSLTPRSSGAPVSNAAGCPRRCTPRHPLNAIVGPRTMKRAAFERVRTLRTWRAHLSTHEQPVLCACDFQLGRFRKSQRVGGCGRARCWLCHSDKLAGRLTRKQQIIRVIEREGIAEVFGQT
jgi:hypothetical protein